MTGQASRFRGTIIGPSVFLAGEKRTTFCRDLSQGGRDSRIRPLSSVGAKGAESGGKSRQIRRPFHPDYYFLRKMFIARTKGFFGDAGIPSQQDHGRFVPLLLLPSRLLTPATKSLLDALGTYIQSRCPLVSSTLSPSLLPFLSLASSLPYQSPPSD